jgi:hypothetical protein
MCDRYFTKINLLSFVSVAGYLTMLFSIGCTCVRRISGEELILKYTAFAF